MDVTIHGLIGLLRELNETIPMKCGAQCPALSKCYIHSLVTIIRFLPDLIATRETSLQFLHVNFMGAISVTFENHSHPLVYVIF